jgi:hypothetical protein
MYSLFCVRKRYVGHVEPAIAEEPLLADEALTYDVQWVCGSCLKLQVYLVDSFLLHGLGHRYLLLFQCFQLPQGFYLLGKWSNTKSPRD